MNTNRRHAVAALTGAGLLWGTTVPLSKLALEWLPTGWLTATRFGLAAAVLLAVARPRLRAAFTPTVLASGAIGYGGTVIVQNTGITRTSVTHAALLIGAAPVLVAVIAALWQGTVARPVAWAGFALSLAGVGLVAGGGGGGASMRGDGLVLASLLLACTFTVGQARLLPGRDPVAVTAVQFSGAALAAFIFTAITEGVPAAPAGPGPVLAVAALVAGGTLAPFTLFAYGQTRVSAEIAGAFLNLEPLIGAVAGAVAFGDRVGPAQIAGGAAILAGIGLSSLPLLGRVGERAADQELAARERDRVVSAGPQGSLATRVQQVRVVRAAGHGHPGRLRPSRRTVSHGPFGRKKASLAVRAGRVERKVKGLSRPYGPAGGTSGPGGRRARRRRWRPARLALR